MDEVVSSDDDRDHTNSSMITKPEIKIGDEFLKILHDNSFNGVDGSDVTDHIAKVLEITEWIKIPNVDKDELRLHVFSKSLSGDDEKWLKSDGTATTWKELGNKFFHKYYPLSHTYKSKIPNDLDHGSDYFEFLYWRGTSKFDNYWELDKNIKKGLWEFYVNEQTKGTIDDLVKYNEPCEENNKKTCSDLFFKPYLDAQDGKDIYEIIDRDYSPIPIPAHHDISNTDEPCQTEEFTVVQYLIGSCEQFITVGPSKISIVGKTPGSIIMSTPDYIYHIIVPSDSNVEDAFSSTNTPDNTPDLPDYFPASLGNTSLDPSDDLSKYLLASLAISPFHDDPYMKVMQAYNATSNESHILLP
ncbi:hypothetical protein Tco_0858545 [Tanacetum coccineum]|uniref:Uncharacterized protein n=1 Tax=Tanacetum coccineum TaxID=301880 RepID=A0ABQ5BCE4_9ASTR